MGDLFPFLGHPGDFAADVLELEVDGVILGQGGSQIGIEGIPAFGLICSESDILVGGYFNHGRGRVKVLGKGLVRSHLHV